MSQKLYAIPAPDVRVRSPDHSGADLPPEGDWIIDSVYWRRREADQDVTLSAKAPKAKPQTQENKD